MVTFSYCRTTIEILIQWQLLPEIVEVTDPPK